MALAWVGEWTTGRVVVGMVTLAKTARTSCDTRPKAGTSTDIVINTTSMSSSNTISTSTSTIVVQRHIRPVLMMCLGMG